MKDIMHLQFLNNPVQLYVEVFGVILVAYIIKRIISRYLATLLFRLFTKVGKNFHKKAFLELIVGPLETFIFFSVSIIALDKLALPAIFNFTVYGANTRTILEGLANTALIIIFIRLCLGLIKFVAFIFEERANLTLDQSDNQLVVFFRDFFRVLFYIIGFLLVLHFTFHYDVSKLITGLSIVGAAIALATKESLENLIASFIIFFDKPFTTGDQVKVQGFTGNVEKIGLRSTRIRTDQKTYITVPNKQMVDTILDNISLRSQRRVEVKLEINLSVTAAQLRQVIPSLKKILQRQSVENSSVFFSDTGKNAHIITVEYFTSIVQTVQQFNALREEINLEIIELLDSKEIPFFTEPVNILMSQNK